MMMGGCIIKFHALMLFLLYLGSILGSIFATKVGETMCKERERHALLMFKQGLRDDYGILSSWKDDEHNGRGRDCCKWEGIQCNNETGYVEILDLHYCSETEYVSGEISPSLVELQHLLYLDLSCLSSGTRIPEFLGSFPDLRYLNLSPDFYNYEYRSAYFVGPIPPQLGNLSQLEYLDLSFNYLDGAIPLQLGNLFKLQYLDLNSNKLNGAIPFQLGGLLQLQHLHLSGNELVGVIPVQLGNLSLLQSLMLGYNENLTTYDGDQNHGSTEWLSNLSSLTHLDLTRVQNLTSLHFLGKLSSLKMLYLSGCDLSDADILPLSSSGLNLSTSLTVLHLSYNHLTSPSIFQWVLNFSTNLQELDISHNSFRFTMPHDFGDKMHSLEYINLGGNNLEGEIPKSIGSICTLKYFFANRNQFSGGLSSFIGNSSKCITSSLEQVILSGNQISGTIPDLSTISSLKGLALSGNRLTGEIPTSLGLLPELESLKLTGNHFQGVISESHFTNLSELKDLELSGNSLTIKFPAGWVPPFQLLYLGLSSCKLDSGFPNWLQNQTDLQEISITNIGNLDPVPEWLWGKLQTLNVFNISGNNLTETIPNLSLKLPYSVIDMSSNYFEGSIPLFLLQTSALFLSKNKLSDFIPLVCDNRTGHNLEVLDLSNNQIKHELPDCWNNLPSLKYLDLSNNKMVGKIPFSMGALANMEALILRNNSLIGELPSSSLKNCSQLTWLDLGENKFYGPIPLWIGDKLQQLVVLTLRSNYFNGSLPSNLCLLRKLQVLDLSLNSLSRGIPACMNNFAAMAKDTTGSADSLTHDYEFKLSNQNFKDYYDLYLVLMWKGVDRGFKNADFLLYSIDLSSNHLTGEIPTEFEFLYGLVSLNLSRNNLSGEIISGIGNLKSLEFLDLSRNHFSGRIPSSLSQIDRLTMLDLSNNDLSGKIPTGTQLQGFNASVYEGNPNLCGEPLERKCQEELTEEQKPPVKVRDDSSIFLEAFYMSMGIGFFTGFCGFIGSILVIPSWKETYSKFLNKLVIRICKSMM